AKLQLKETIITAPFDGVVSELNITKGDRVSPQMPVATFISHELEAEVSVPESQISQLETGQSSSLQVTAYPGQDFPAVLTSVSPVADPKSRTFSVKVTPTEGQDLLRSGMFADVHVLAQENKNVTLAPIEAIIRSDPPTVFVVNKDNTVSERTVTTGLFDQTSVEILQGLQPGDLVVVAGQSNLHDGVIADITNDPRIAE
ncbi:MAG: efflux RND transporter periplasmic adaptor subunit, partial [Chloroflexi bacterium]